MERRRSERRSGLVGFHNLKERYYNDRRWIKKKDFWGAGKVEDSLDKTFGKAPRSDYYAFHNTKIFFTRKTGHAT